MVRSSAASTGGRANSRTGTAASSSARHHHAAVYTSTPPIPTLRNVALGTGRPLRPVGARVSAYASALQQRWSECPPAGHRQAVGVGVKDLHADVVGTGIQVGTHPLGD